MANFSESLTVRILGDSSHLERTLEGVARRIGEMQSQLAQSAEAPAGLGRMVANFGMLVRPLEAVSRMLERVTGQVQLLSRIPITLNVGPALASLSVLSQAIDAVAAKLALLSVMPMLGFGFPMPFPMPVRAFASGGLVNGPAGMDRVPAMLTAGEFVLGRRTVERLGVAFLNALNQNALSTGATARAATPASMASPAGTQITNFGGVTVQVTQMAHVNDVLRDLRLGEGRLRVRRG